jgi:hypothetical protein
VRESRHDVATGQHITRAKQHGFRTGSVNRNRAGFGIDHPHQPGAGVEPLGDLLTEVRVPVSRTSHLDGQVRRPDVETARRLGGHAIGPSHRPHCVTTGGHTSSGEFRLSSDAFGPTNR